MVNCIINFASTCIIQVKLNNLIKSIIQTIVYWNDSIFACLSLYFAISTIVVTSATKTFSHRMRMWFCWSLTTFALQIRIHLINVDQKQCFVSIDIPYICHGMLGIPRTSGWPYCTKPWLPSPTGLGNHPLCPWHMRFALWEAATSDQMFETMLSAPWHKTRHRIMS